MTDDLAVLERAVCEDPGDEAARRRLARAGRRRGKAPCALGLEPHEHGRARVRELPVHGCYQETKLRYVTWGIGETRMLRYPMVGETKCRKCRQPMVIARVGWAVHTQHN